MNIHTIFALIIFVLTYTIFVTEKVNKSIAVLLGASFYLVLHFIPFDDAVEHIDINVILLLMGMMLIVKITEQCGVFEYVAIKAAKAVKADPTRFLIALFFLTAFFSALLDNVTTVLLVSPVTLLLTTQMEIAALPFIITEILASNIGGTATLIGDPPNIMIGSAAKLSFMDFAANLTPVVLIISVVTVAILLFVFRKSLVITQENKERILKMDESKMIHNKTLMIKSLVVLGGVLLGFLLHGIMETEPSVIAVIGACALIIWTNEDMEKLLQKVEWDTILFFLGLFIMVGVLEYAGIIDALADWMIRLTGGQMKTTSSLLLYFSGIFSGILDNIPLVATFIPVVKLVGAGQAAGDLAPLWWSLSLGACLGGNGTLVGASANVIMFGFAKKNKVPLTFISYLKYGVPLTLLSLVISYAYIMVRYY
ncbi:MAG: ArsB/NhaD family transporter [Spirochaetales bacterium]|nr:ArsB/NhaD family transporter [Spirochaetales bacterium]